MATKTAAEKLWIKEGKDLAFFNAPENNEELMGDYPEGVDIVENDPADILLAYIEDRLQLEKHLPDLKNKIKPDGALWIAYHKGTSNVDTDINRDTIAAFGLKNGLKPVAMISINDDWSALRFKLHNS